MSSEIYIRQNWKNCVNESSKIRGADSIVKWIDLCLSFNNSQGHESWALFTCFESHDKDQPLMNSQIYEWKDNVDHKSSLRASINFKIYKTKFTENKTLICKSGELGHLLQEGIKTNILILYQKQTLP